MKVRNPILLAAAAAALAPASALAATATITGDAGSPVPLGGAVTIRHMSPELNYQFAPDEKRYGAFVTGPAGASASVGEADDCFNTNNPLALRIRYQGNGPYKVLLKTSKVEDDFDCAQAATQELTFTINAFTSITPPAAVVLTREPGSFSTLRHAFRMDLNPGAGTHEVRFSTNPDGGQSGVAFERGFVDNSTGTAGISFAKPGRYQVTARATSFSGGTETGTPWTAPVTVTALAPFDLIGNPSFPDSRGPTYKVRGQVREPSATGKVAVAIARGKRGGRFKKLGSAKIRANGSFTKRFRLKRRGTYRLRYLYKGGPTVAPGGYVQQIKITRRLF